MTTPRDHPYSQDTYYTPVNQSEDTTNPDPPPQYEHPPQVFPPPPAPGYGAPPISLPETNRVDMPQVVDLNCGGSRTGLYLKLGGTLFVLLLGVFIACMVDSYHKINEGNVGIYYRYGALSDRVSDPGVHFSLPFVDSFIEIQIRPETVQLEPVLAITRDGIENKFNEITVITTVRKDNLTSMVKSYGVEFKRSLVYDRIKEDLRIFCASNTIDDVYNEKFLTIVENVKKNVVESIDRLAEGGIVILNLVIPKPDIPEDIAQNYKQVKVQWTEQLVATQQKRTEEIKKETEQLKAVADANRQKAVLEIKIEERIIEVEGQKNVSLINNEIKKEAEKTKADIHKYKLEQEALANSQLYSEEYVKLNLAKALANNTKFYFSGQQSELGALFNQILGTK